MHRVWLAALAAAYTLAASAAEPTDAQAWPEQPVTLVMSVAPNSGIDALAQLLRGPLERELRTPLALVYRPEAGGGAALAYVAKARADGYTILFGILAMEGAAGTLDKVSADVEAALAPLAVVRLLGTTAPQRADARPDVPAIAEAAGDLWLGLFAPKGIDARIADKIRAAVRRTVESPALQSRMQGMGRMPQHATVEEFRASINVHRAGRHDVVNAVGATEEVGREPALQLPSSAAAPVPAPPARRAKRATKGETSPNWKTELWR